MKILSFLPTKVAVSTSILPKLDYDNTVNFDMEKSKRMELFIDRNLPACVSSLSVHLINLNVSNFGLTLQFHGVCVS